MNDMLSQKEIDELIAKATGNGPAGLQPELNSTEIDTLGEIGNISMGAAATALYAILGRQVMITTPDVSITTLERLAADHVLPFVVVDVEYTEGFLGSSLFFLQLDDVKVITDIMMGGEGHPDLSEELSELHISAISEAMNQMMGGMATSMAEMFNRIVNISPPRSMVVHLGEQHIHDLFQKDHKEVIKICFKLEIEGLMNSNIMQLMPLEFGRQLVAGLLGETAAQPAAPSIPAIPSASAAPIQPAAIPAPVAAAPYQVPAMPAAMPAPAAAPRPAVQQPIDVRPIQLTSFDEPNGGIEANFDNSIGLILDVPLQITVELGQCRKTIQEILDLNIGSIVTLDKLAGEPVDVVVNGKAVAKGEVIVIDDSYGIRITEVLTANRLKTSAAVSAAR